MRSRLLLANNTIQLTDEITIHIVPSAHPVVEKNAHGGWNAIGYIIEYQDLKFYHAGDTLLCDEVIESIQSYGKIDQTLKQIKIISRN